MVDHSLRKDLSLLFSCTMLTGRQRKKMNYIMITAADWCNSKYTHFTAQVNYSLLNSSMDCFYILHRIELQTDTMSMFLTKTIEIEDYQLHSIATSFQWTPHPTSTPKAGEVFRAFNNYSVNVSP